MAGNRPDDIQDDTNDGMVSIAETIETRSTVVPDVSPDTTSDTGAAETRQAKNKGGRPKGAKTDAQKMDLKKTAQVIDLAVRGVNKDMIARAVQLPETTVRNKLKAFEGVFKELEHVDDYRSAKSKLLSAGELKILKKMMSAQKLKTANVSSLAYAFNTLNNANRLEQGKATSHVAVHHTDVDLSDCQSADSSDDADLDPI